MRALHSPEGLGDRLRLVAFAERQAFNAFTHAAEFYTDAPPGLTEAWKWVAQEEAKHESWLVKRLEELGQELCAVPVNLNLYHSLVNCQSAREFSLYVSDAEDRGRIGAEKFAEVLAQRDPVTASIFQQIALEELEHIKLVERFFS
ncbi:MAG TPA: ferritin-like domain-containing protein [Bacteriovoracaceae bacterium]|nr:ferritin-like domain-containing protein [Bacteriovoracaceae bacterium]